MKQICRDFNFKYWELTSHTLKPVFSGLHRNRSWNSILGTSLHNWTSIKLVMETKKFLTGLTWRSKNHRKHFTVCMWTACCTKQKTPAQQHNPSPCGWCDEGRKPAAIESAYPPSSDPALHESHYTPPPLHHISTSGIRVCWIVIPDYTDKVRWPCSWRRSASTV